jgi:hypothetical protein
MMMSRASHTDSLRSPIRRQRGFVTTMAIMLMALVAVVVATLMMRISTSARQGRQEQDQAQVEQLLLAGMDRVRGGESQPGEIALPRSLVEEGAKLTIIRSEGQTELEASLGRIVLRQPLPKQ